MSLINQALRKAQRDRSGEQTCASASSNHSMKSDAHQIATTNKSLKPGLIIGAGIIFATLISLVVGLAIIVLNQKTQPTKESPTSSTPETVPQTLAQMTQLTPLSPTETQIETTKQIETIKTTRPSDTIEALRLARKAAEAKALTSAEAARQAAGGEATQEVKPNPEIIRWLERSAITGVRLSGSGNKVLLNGHSFSVDECVNYKFNLKVMVIREKLVLFVDESGTKYLKRL